MLNPYDITKLAVGPSRVLYAPTSVDIPTSLQDIIALNNPYDAKTGWIDFGAAPAGDGASYSRGFDTEGLGIEQETSDIFTEITATNRSFKLTVAEIDPANIAIVEGSSATAEVIEAVKSAEEAEGTTKQERVPLGAISDLPAYRVALIARRKKASVEVKEKDGTTRGGLVAVVLNRCSLAADDAEIAVSRGSLLSAPLSFEAFPDPDAADGEEYGSWLFETADEIE